MNLQATFPLEVEPLMRFLEKTSKIKPSLNQEYNQVLLELKIKDHIIPIYFDIRLQGELLQIVSYLPVKVNKDHLGDMARLLHRFNKDLDMPGYGMDEDQNLLFYRCIVPCLEKQVSEKLLAMYLGALKLACEMAIKTIETINAKRT